MNENLKNSSNVEEQEVQEVQEALWSPETLERIQSCPMQQVAEQKVEK